MIVDLERLARLSVAAIAASAHPAQNDGAADRALALAVDASTVYELVQMLLQVRRVETARKAMVGPRVDDDPLAVALRWNGHCGTREPDFDMHPEDTASFLAAHVVKLTERIRELEAASLVNSSCPCAHTTPCHDRCTCVEPFSSSGCTRCCSYGSVKQQQAAAVRLAELEAANATKAAHETQATIEQWRRDTFGESSSVARLAARANLEMAELLTSTSVGDSENAAVECADVVIVLFGVAERLGVDLFAEIDKKMAINRARVWHVDGGGVGHHVRDKASEP